MKFDEIESNCKVNESMVESKVFVFQRNDSLTSIFYTNLLCKTQTSTEPI